MSESHDPKARAPLSALDLPIRIDRDLRRLSCHGGEIRFGPLDDRDREPRLVQFRVDGTLLPDEMMLILGRPLDWTGPRSREAHELPLVEGVFPAPFVLTRSREVICSGLPQVHALTPGHEVVGWSFLAILVRGIDTPWITPSILRLRQAGPR